MAIPSILHPPEGSIRHTSAYVTHRQTLKTTVTIAGNWQTPRGSVVLGAITMLTVPLPEVDVPGLYDEDHEQGVPGGPVDEGADADQGGEPGAVLDQDVHVGDDHAHKADNLHAETVLSEGSPSEGGGG